MVSEIYETVHLNPCRLRRCLLKKEREDPEKSASHRVLVKGGSGENNRECTFYVKEVTEVVCKQVGFCGRKYFMVRSERRNELPKAVSPTESTDYIFTCF